MDIRHITIDVKGVSPLLQNRKSLMLDRVKRPELNKQRGENYTDLENRTWKLKAHINDQNHVYCPGEWFKRTIMATQKRGKYPLQPPGSRSKNQTMLPYFISGLFIEDSEILINKNPITEKDLLPFESVVTPPGQGSVICIRPMIKDPWYLNVNITIIDDAISEKCVFDVMNWCGLYMGIGDFRPQNGGNFGRFEITNK
jgi:hypothetical protein